MPEFDRELGFRGAPHSSQYCDPSRFSVLHLSHVIISVFGGGAWARLKSARLPRNRRTQRGKLWILARNQRPRQLSNDGLCKCQIIEEDNRLCFRSGYYLRPIAKA